MGVTIGIDLGTTNSVIGLKQGSASRVVQNIENEDLTRSLVSYYKGKILVGALAFDRMASAPKDTIISIKRLMGRAFSDPEVQNVKKNYHFEIVSPTDGTSDDLRVILGGKEYSPIQISSMILKKLKDDAESRLGQKVEYAVITVPAYFVDKQIEATKKAAKLAGLKVQKILDEPTAAAIAYGIDNISSNEIKTILVYDLGGGTFDVSVLTISGGAFAQLDKEGDMWLGGDDFDHKIMNYVVDCIKKEYDVDPTTNLKFMVDLKKKAEKAKITLSSTTRTDVIIPGLLQDKKGDLVDVEVELSRDQFEMMIAKEVKESMKLVEMSMENAGLTSDQIDNVLLVGGSSSIPMVQRVLEERFGKEKVLKNVDPMKCVAFGASILSTIRGEQIECTQGHINSGDQEVCSVCGEQLVNSEVILGGVTPMHYGIQTEGDKFDVIIPKGSAYPSPEPVEKTFYTPVPNMRRIKVPVYAGLKEAASQNELQVTIWLELPENVPQNTSVKVAFQLNTNGSLENAKVSLLDGSGRMVEVYPDRGGEKRSQVEKKLHNVEEKINNKKNSANAGKMEEIEKKYNDAIRAANNNEIDASEKMVNEVEKMLEDIEGSKPKLPDWIDKCDLLVFYSEVIIESFNWLFGPEESYKIKQLIEDLKRLMAEKNQQAAEKVYDDLNSKVKSFVRLADVVIAIRISSNKKDLVTADKLRSGLKDIENALRKPDIDAAVKILNELDTLVDKVFQGDGGKAVGGLLSSQRRSITQTGEMKY